MAVLYCTVTIVNLLRNPGLTTAGRRSFFKMLGFPWIFQNLVRGYCCQKRGFDTKDLRIKVVLMLINVQSEIRMLTTSVNTGLRPSLLHEVELNFLVYEHYKTLHPGY